MQNNNSKTLLQKRRAISPILATVVLLGITVVAGGLVYSVFSSSATAASSADVIAIQNAQAVKGTSHADVTVTVKNAGGQPWTKVEMTLAKSELSEPILYESLHENVVGCKDDGTPTASDCKDGVDNAESGADGNRENPLRAQWLASLDKTGGEANKADPGEGISVGRKLVFESKDDYRTLTVLNGTAVAPLFGGEDSSASTALSTKMTDLGISACTPSTDTDCTAQFNALDAIKGKIYCSSSSDDTIAATCKIFTHTSIEGEPISSGQSIFFYADAFTQEVPGLNNQVLRVGDNLVVNIATENADGGTARAQTIIKVTGV